MNGEEGGKEGGKLPKGKCATAAAADLPPLSESLLRRSRIAYKSSMFDTKINWTFSGRSTLYGSAIPNRRIEFLQLVI